MFDQSVEWRGSPAWLRNTDVIEGKFRLDSNESGKVPTFPGTQWVYPLAVQTVNSPCVS